MTPDERDRLTTLEVEMETVKASISKIEANTDALVKAFNIGQGGAIAAAKLGGFILMAFMGLGWLIDHIPHWLGAK